MDILAFLTANGITYQLFEHPPVFTCEEAERLCPNMPGLATKNLFVRDRKGSRHILVIVPYTKSVDLKALKDLLDADKLSFASDERLLHYLGVTPGAVTLLGLACDRERAVEVVLDNAVAEAESIHCHPLRNTASVVLEREDVQRFLATTGHQVRVMDVPSGSV